MTYKIIRVYRPDLGKRSKLVKASVSLDEAQKHCSDPATSTATYFDTYERN